MIKLGFDQLDGQPPLDIVIDDGEILYIGRYEWKDDGKKSDNPVWMKLGSKEIITGYFDPGNPVENVVFTPNTPLAGFKPSIMTENWPAQYGRPIVDIVLEFNEPELPEKYETLNTVLD